MGRTKINPQWPMYSLDDDMLINIIRLKIMVVVENDEDQGDKKE